MVWKAVGGILGAIAALINLLKGKKPKPSKAKKIIFVKLVCGPVTLEGDITMYKIPNIYDLSLSIQPVDAKGQPAPVDGVPVWAVSDEAIAALNPAADGLSCVVVPLVPLSSTFQVRVTADADLGDGTRTLEGSIDLEVGPSEAVALGITVGELIPKV
jgi:hypothetical protein